MSLDLKIERLLEQSKMDPKILNTLIASAGGALGAGLDLYLSGHTDISDFIKPMTAWGTGGALGSLSMNSKKEEKEEKEDK